MSTISIITADTLDYEEYVSVQVEPERPDYDPATRGTTLYLVTKTGTRSTEIKSVKLLLSSSD